MKVRMKIGDLLVYVLIGLLIGGSFVGLHWMKARVDEQRVVIEVNGRQVESVPFTPDMNPRTVRVVADDGGYNIVRISAAGVEMIEADCPDQICVRSGRIRYVGQTIVCLPHKVLVKIVGEPKEEPPVDEIAS